MKFEFGTGTSAYQVEGAYQEDDKLLSIWDTLTHQENTIFDHSNGDVANDFYHRYEEDILLGEELGLDCFRLSFSMCRILKENGTINEKGLAFYDRVIDCILAHHMKPVVTLFHWDLPQFLQDRGGFLSRDIISYFSIYVKAIAQRFKHKVHTWLTFNEPQCFIGLGYHGNEHAPRWNCSLKDMMIASHHVLLCHGKAYQILKRNDPTCIVSFVNTFGVAIPKIDDEEVEEYCYDLTFKTPKKADEFYSVSIFADPLFLGHYPEEYEERMTREGIQPSSEDMNLISQARPDRIDLNIYTGIYYMKNKEGEIIMDDTILEEEKTEFAWLKARPKALYYGPKYFYLRYHLPIVISENGVPYQDIVDHQKIHDEKRSRFILAYFKELKKAKEEGIDIQGYYYWSLVDNFEWAFGYSRRFGLVYIDYDDNLRRIKKDSFYTYQDLIRKVKG